MQNNHNIVHSIKQHKITQQIKTATVDTQEIAIYFNIYSTPLDIQKLYDNLDKVIKIIVIQHKIKIPIFSFLFIIFHLLI